MNPQQLRDLDRYLTTPPELDDEPTDDGWCELDEQPAPEPAAPAYDVDASDAEWHNKPVTSVAMALDVLRSGRALMAQCGPLQVTLTPDTSALWCDMAKVTFTVWNTVTCADVSVIMGGAQSQVEPYLHAYGHVADGAWRVYCPDEPDGAPLY